MQSKEDIWVIWPDDFMCKFTEIEEFPHRSDDYKIIHVLQYDENGIPSEYVDYDYEPTMAEFDINIKNKTLEDLFISFTNEYYIVDLDDTNNILKMFKENKDKFKENIITDIFQNFSDIYFKSFEKRTKKLLDENSDVLNLTPRPEDNSIDGIISKIIRNASR